MNRQTLLSCFHFDAITPEECVTKSFWNNSFFQSYSKRVSWTNSFSQSSQRVMTEGFLKPNAKTAFFKAILKKKLNDYEVNPLAQVGCKVIMNFA